MSKYKAEKITVDGYRFDSKVEAKFYKHLKDLKAQGLIQNFELQPSFTLIPKFEKNEEKFRALIYKADFTIYHNKGGIEVIDIKGMATPEAKLKRKLFNYTQSYPLKWLVWYKGEWMNYDEVQKIRRGKKKNEKV